MATDEWGTTTVSDDDFAFDGSGKSESDLGSAMVNREGWYHFEVADVVRDLELVSPQGKPKSPSIRFDLVVLKDVEGQSPAGSRHYHRIYLGDQNGGPPKEGSVKSAFRFGVGLEILAELQIDGQPAICDAETGSPKIKVSTWERAKGLQLCCRIENREEQEGSKYGPSFEIPFARVWHPLDEAVKDVPKNEEAIALLPPRRKPAAKAATTQKSAKSPAAKPTTPAPAPVPSLGMSDEDLADL